MFTFQFYHSKIEKREREEKTPQIFPTLEESCERPTNDRCECENIELQANADSM